MSYPVYTVYAGDVLPIFFDSFDGGTGASLTMTGLAVTDIEIYKDGSATQRSSDAGYTLLDTDGIDFDGITGIHGFSIDTGNNTDAGFYAVGSWFHVVVSSVTIDGQTVNFIAAAFRIVAAEVVAGVPLVDVKALLGTAITETSAGYLAAGFKKLHDVASPVFTLASVNQTGDSYNDLKDGGRTDLLIDGIAGKTVNLPASPAAVGSAMDLVADAIKKTTYDESTAFPVLSADTGATAIARTGADGDTIKTISDQIDNVSTAVGAGVPTSVASSANTETTGSLISGTYANTDLDNGAYWVTAPAAGGLDVSLTFALGTKRGNVVTINGKYNAAVNKYVDVYAYNYLTSSWGKLSDTSTRMNHSTSDLNYQYTLLGAHTKVDGEAKIRFVSIDTNTGYRLSIDQCIIQAVQASATADDIANAVYDKMKYTVYDGGVWIDTVAGTAGTDVGVHGLPTHPVSNLADAVTLAAAIGIKRYYLKVGSSIQLISAHQKWNFIGDGTIDLNGQDTAGSRFEGCKLTGDFGGYGGNRVACEIYTASNVVGSFHECELRGVIGMGAGDAHFMNCVSRGPNPGYAPEITMGASTTYVAFRMYSGKVTLKSLTGTQIVSFDCPAGELILDVSSDGGEVRLRGVHTFTNNSTGPTVTDNAIDPADVSAILVDTGTTLDDLVDDLESRLTAARAGYLDNLQYYTQTKAGYLDAAVSTRSSHSAADVWAAVTRTLTDRTGFSLSVAGILAIWHQLESEIVTASTIGARIKSYLDAKVSEVGGGALTAEDIADAVLDEPAAGHTGVIATNLDAKVSDVPTVAEIDTQLSGTHGSGAWGAGSTGSSTYTDTITDDDGDPLEDVQVEVYSDSDYTTLVAVEETNVSGVFTFSLNPATYYVRCIKSGYTFADFSKVVS